MLLCSSVRWPTDFKIKLHFIKIHVRVWTNEWEQTLVSLKIFHCVNVEPSPIPTMNLVYDRYE